jgi:hypothetical protein
MKKVIKIKVIPVVLILGMVLSPIPSYATSSQSQTIPVTKNPIVNTSTKIGFTIVTAQVQDNTDPKSGKPIPDRLALKVRNTSAKAISAFEIYYTMINQITKASESYYQKLTNFSIPKKSIGYIAFDNTKNFGHFPENKYSIYRNSTNEVKFTIELSAKGFKPQMAVAIKAKGTTENPNG